MTEPHTLDVILNAASIELRTHGIDGFRIRKVSERAGVSPGTVTHYFATSRDLLEATIDDFQRRAWTLWTEHPLSEGTASVRGLVDELYALCRENREMIRARFFLTARDGQVSEPNWRGSLKPFLDTIGRGGRTDTRLIGHSVVLLAMRYAVHPEAELMVISGTDEPKAAHQAVRDHLCAMACCVDWPATGS